MSSMSSKEAPRGAYFTAPNGTTVTWVTGGLGPPGSRPVVEKLCRLNNRVSWSGLNDPAGELAYRHRYREGLPLNGAARLLCGADTEAYYAWEGHLMAISFGLEEKFGRPHPQDVIDFGVTANREISLESPKPPVQPPAPVNPPPPLPPPPAPVVSPAGKSLSPVPQRLEELRVIWLQMLSAAGPLINTPCAVSIRIWLEYPTHPVVWPYTKQLLAPALEMWRALKARAERP